MSQQNVEIVRRWLDFGSTSPERLRSDVARFFDDDADYYPVRKFPDARPCHGHDEIVQFYAGNMGAWSRYEYAIRELVDAGDDRVLACGSVNAEGQESGLILEGDLYHCMWLRHGRFFRVEDHLTMKGALHALGFDGETLEEAGLKAAGVAEEPMSANLKLVRSIYSDWERGDWRSSEWAHPRIEMEFVGGPTPGTWLGRGGIAEGWREFLGVWDEFRSEADEYRELDDERIVALTRWGGRGKTSRLDLDQVSTRSAVAFHVQDSKVTRLVAYFDRDRAIADLGLEA